MFAAICARRSPAVSCLERICARISRKTSATISPRLDDLDRRDDHALLEDLAERADARGRAAADVDVVREVRDVAEQLAVRMHGRDQADVVQVHAARKGVVRDDHVAGAEVLRAVVADRARHLLDHRAEVHRLREALRDRAQLGVEECAGEVGARLDVRRVRAASSASTISSVAATSALRITSNVIGSITRAAPCRRRRRPRRAAGSRSRGSPQPPPPAMRWT